MSHQQVDPLGLHHGLEIISPKTCPARADSNILFNPGYLDGRMPSVSRDQRREVLMWLIATGKPRGNKFGQDLHHQGIHPLFLSSDAEACSTEFGKPD